MVFSQLFRPYLEYKSTCFYRYLQNSISLCRHVYPHSPSRITIGRYIFNYARKININIQMTRSLPTRNCPAGGTRGKIFEGVWTRFHGNACSCDCLDQSDGLTNQHCNHDNLTLWCRVAVLGLASTGFIDCIYFGHWFYVCQLLFVWCLINNMNWRNSSSLFWFSRH